MNDVEIRYALSTDIPLLRQVVEETGLFPGDMLEEMITPFFEAGSGTAIWLSAVDQGTPIGLCYAAAEALTNGTWNMLALAVLPSRQGRGFGRRLVVGLEDALRARDQRLVIVDTSGAAAFADTRAFYQRLGYAEMARIPDFWDNGDDKVTFVKKL